MKDALKFVCYALVFVAFIWLVTLWPIYRYKDCKRVGHTTLYCVMTIGN